MWKEFPVAGVGDTLDMNFDSRFAEFGAEVRDLNASAALDWRTAHFTDCESGK